MRILFLRHPMRNVGGTGIYTKLLIEALIKRKHVIGLWPTDGMVYQNLHELPIIRMDSTTRMITTDWDVIVIQHTRTVFYANHIIRQLPDVPHIFISHSSQANDQILPYRQLYRVIRIADTLTNSWGVPEEMQEVIFNPIRIPRFVLYTPPVKPPFKILLVSRLNPDRVELVRDIVFAVNQMPDFLLEVVGGGLDYMLRSSANENINFEGEHEDVTGYYRGADLIIGSGRTAVEAMAFAKPVIVAGLRGLGGLVTPGRYERFKKIMFSGRFEGKLNERVPREGLIAAVMAAHKNINLPDICKENYRLVQNDFDLSNITIHFETILAEVIELNLKIRDPREIVSLKPRLASNCEIIRDGQNGCYRIIRLTSGQYLGYVDQEGRKLLSLFNGNKTLLETASGHGDTDKSSLENYVETTQKLWDNKIITF